MARNKKALKDLRQKNGRGEKIVRTKRPCGFTIPEDVVAGLDEYSSEIGLDKSLIVTTLLRQEIRAWQLGLPCIKERMMI